MTFDPSPIASRSRPAALTGLRAPEPLLQLTGVSKTYLTGAATVHAVVGVDLSIWSGEYVAIMGPSGSGKSTLMHILGCLDTPSAGTYVIAGQDVSELDEIDLAWIRNRQVGFVFQQFHLLGRQSAARNAELPLLYAGVRSSTERRTRTEAALAAVGIADRAEHRPGQLSGGQQQRVAIARALVTDPAIILADEPTGNLASDQTNEVLALFEAIHDQGRTVILITHEPDVARRARRLVSVHDGRIVSDEQVTR
jgi:putative ABC transport system ATP-binding protein